MYRCFVVVAITIAGGLAPASDTRRTQQARVPSAHVLFVSPGGADANPGTEARPLATLQRAADLVNPGDTVIAEDGIYTGAGGTPCSGNPVLCLARGGTANAWVTFRARHAGGAKLDGRNNTSAFGIVFRSGGYVAIDGFEIYGFGPNRGAASAHGVMIQAAHDIALNQLHIHDIGRACTDSTFGMTGVFVRVPSVTITRSVFHDIGRLSPGEQGCDPRSLAYQNLDHGIYVDGQPGGPDTPGAVDVVIANNVFYRHQHGWAVTLYPGTLSGIQIVNNTFAFPNPYRDGHVLLSAATSNSVIANNIFYDPRAVAIAYNRGAQSNLAVHHNLTYHATLMSAVPGGTIVASNQEADPLFVNATTPPYDFHITSRSPAVGAAAPLPFVTVDFDGVKRVAPIDAGAYQSGR